MTMREETRTRATVEENISKTAVVVVLELLWVVRVGLSWSLTAKM